MQVLPSLQSMAVPPQAPALQVSLVVQTLPSVQGSVLLVCVQPEPGLQASVVQALPSLQFGALPAWHWPLTQVSTPSQTLLLLQSA